jgi:quercetin dioxygenase-like cupin family protein
MKTAGKAVSKATLLPAARTEVTVADWGALTWYASAKLGNSQHMTVGKCVIRPGLANPRHSHPNCEEVLVVIQGTIEHEIEDGRHVIMRNGDAITIPQGLLHNARNIGTHDAILLVVFSSARREVKGE